MTELATVLEALHRSPRLSHWHKPPRDYGPDNPEDSDYNRNGLKDVSKLSTVIVSPGCSFIEPPEDGDEFEEPHRLQCPVKEVSEERLPSPDPVERSSCELPESLVMARTALLQNKLRWMLEDMNLEEKLNWEAQKRLRARQQAIVEQVYRIRLHSAQRLWQFQQQREQQLAEEEAALKQQEEENARASAALRQECQTRIEEQSAKLMAAVKAAQKREAEQASQRQELINQVVSSHHTCTDKLALMEQLLGEFEGSLTLDAKTETLLNQRLSNTQEVLTSAQQNTATHTQLQAQLKSLQEGCTYLDSVIESLKEKKAAKLKADEQAQQAAEEAQQQEAAAAAAAATVKEEQEQNAPQQRQTPPQLEHWNSRIEGWKKEAERYLAAKDQVHKNKLLEVKRKVAIINQFNVCNNTVNREKLQKLLALLKGQGTEWGGLPHMLDYVKSEVVLGIVKQATMSRNEGTVALYAWVMVNVLTYLPELWGLFVCHLSSRCLCLFNPVPRYGQSIEAYLDSVGYNSIGAGNFSAHVDSCAHMYGMVLAMLGNKECPLPAPAIAWEYLATILALPPISGITAEILDNFLRCCGHHLLRIYGRQFLKVLDYVGKVYMPRLEEVVDTGGQQSFIMLHKLMTDFSTSRTLPLNENINKYR